MAQSYEHRKPVMDETRRKVLNLLEFVLELDPATHSVDAVFYVLRCSEGVWTDEEMAVVLEGYARDLLQEKQDEQHEV
jgi:hypothetical protein